MSLEALEARMGPQSRGVPPFRRTPPRKTTAGLSRSRPGVGISPGLGLSGLGRMHHFETQSRTIKEPLDFAEPLKRR